MNIVREELSKTEGTTDSSATGTNLQILCDDSLTTVRSCSVGANAGCLGNKPPNNLPEGTNVLAGGGTAAKTIDIGICGPFTPPPLRLVECLAFHLQYCHKAIEQVTYFLRGSCDAQ